MADCDPVLPVIPWYSQGAEIGVARGKSTERFIEERKCFVILVDPWCDYEGYPEKLGSGDAFSECMARLKPHSLKWLALRMKSVDAAKVLVPPTLLDWVFIDGNHTFDYVLEDCRAWWPLIKPGGVMCGHDWNLHVFQYGVQRAVQQFASELNLPITVHGDENNGQLQCWSINKPKEAANEGSTQ